MGEKREAPTWGDVLESQEQVISRAQAMAGGLTGRAWDIRLARDWRSVVPGVAAAHTGPLTDKQRDWAAVLHAGSGALLSGDAALAARGFKGLTSKAVRDVAIPAPRKARPAAGSGLSIVCHRVTNLERWSKPLDGLAMVNPHVAVLHACAWAPSERAGEWRLAAAVQQQLTAVPLLRQALAEMPKLPRRALIRVVLDDVELGAHAASELQFLRFCRSHGLPLPDELQVRVRAGTTRYLDARYRRQKVSVEVDGAHHRWVEHWESDVLRSLQLAAARHGTGEQLLRITPFAMRHDASEAAAALRTVLLG